MTVFGYIRVSTLKQTESGLGLAAQKESIAGYAKQLGVSVGLWLSDKGVSGSTELKERKQGSLLLEKAKAGDVIICAKLDRMFRSAKNALEMLEEFKARNVALHFIDLGGDCSNGIGKLVFTILSAVAEQERNRITERISEAKQSMRRDGRYQGGKVAFGYKVVKGKLIKDELQQRCLGIMKRKRAAGMSFRKISEYLEEELKVSISHNAIRVILAGKRKTAL